MNIVKAHRNLRPQISEFYQSVGYHGDWGKDEAAYCCLSNGIVIGCVKIEKRKSYQVIRGLYVASDYHGEGLGSSLLRHIQDEFETTTTYCLPFSHLQRFYTKYGFEKLSADKLPKKLQRRLQRYHAIGYQVIAMVYLNSKSEDDSNFQKE